MEGIVLNFRLLLDPSKLQVLNTLSTGAIFQILVSFHLKDFGTIEGREQYFRF